MGLILCLPIFIIISCLIKLNDTGPIFFKQERIGQNFRKFKFYKFRTMVVDADKIGPNITKDGDPRILPIGRFLRKYKIDEIPQLINVVKGDISLVGPRPELEKYVIHFKEEYQDILRVKPGITDFATLEFRNEEEVLKKYEDVHEGYIREVLPRKIQLYKKYIEQASFWTDIKIIFKTLWRIIL